MEIFKSTTFLLIGEMPLIICPTCCMHPNLNSLGYLCPSPISVSAIFCKAEVGTQVELHFERQKNFAETALVQILPTRSTPKLKIKSTVKKVHRSGY